MNAAWLEIEQRLKAEIRSLLATINAAEARHLEDRHTWQALASEQAARADELERQRDRLIEALTPSTDTKRAYMGEMMLSCGDDRKLYVPWTAIKDTMAMIRKRAVGAEQVGE